MLTPSILHVALTIILTASYATALTSTQPLSPRAIEGCTADEQAHISAARAECARKATAAADATLALNDHVMTEKVREYFRLDDTATRTSIAERFQNIQKYCAGAAGAAEVTLSCTDPFGQCTITEEFVQVGPQPFLSANASAYASWKGETGEDFHIHLCPLFFGPSVPLDSGVCHKADQGTTMTNSLILVHSINGYTPIKSHASGYDALVQLITEDPNGKTPLHNADSYAYFANAVDVIKRGNSC